MSISGSRFPIAELYLDDLYREPTFHESETSLVDVTVRTIVDVVSSTGKKPQLVVTEALKEHKT
jgi:hypothetical protein